jgi:arsenite transporter
VSLPFLRILAAAGRHGRLLLIAGLLMGIFAAPAAAAVRPHVGELIATLLFLACLRIGPRQAIGIAGDVGAGLKAGLALQLLVPLAAVLLFRLVGWTGPTALGLTLMLSASPISGTPNLVAMVGSDPAPALRQLVVGTALLPFTAFVVFLFAPGIGGTATLFFAAAKLLLIIAGAAVLGFGIRLTVLKTLSSDARDGIDGCSAIVMAVVVVGLMSAIGETWPRDPQLVIWTAAVAFAANLTLQVAAALLVAKAGKKRLAVALGVSAGNRNVALFLTALPAATTDAALLFIGCYQVPMYLTPLVLGRFYRRISESAAHSSSPIDAGRSGDLSKQRHGAE